MANNDQINNQEFADIVRSARGNRSLREYAQLANVSYMTIYKAERGEYIPSSKTIKKLSTGLANPQNGVTYEDMMVAAGYQDKEAVSETASILAEQMVEESYSDNNNQPIVTINHKGISMAGNRGRLDYLEYERRVTGIILSSMVQNNIYFSNNRAYDGGIRSRVPDVILDIEKAPITQWWFEIRYFSETRRFTPISVQLTLANALAYQNSKTTKGSIVVNTKDAFDFLARRAYQIAYRGELSVILVDEFEQKVIAERYLSNYFEGDHSSEILLV
ncbi:MAG: helix-turn-helix transcriptional regulator [Butyrivibrio sp.]|uniref:helix-turn-helix domain-containing protein n=1 Tax=Butyrivibrio sp. TaxID=28121 RepID=UPI001B3FDFA7|nr:helix-turn-helix transcriptional regulator [Butyrivibrio sp.]MBP3781791.1 helix-turn-helix transcriptional regulator [Butyrivibrio sp.]